MGREIGYFQATSELVRIHLAGPSNHQPPSLRLWFVMIALRGRCGSENLYMMNAAFAGEAAAHARCRRSPRRHRRSRVRCRAVAVVARSRVASTSSTCPRFGTLDHSRKAQTASAFSCPLCLRALRMTSFSARRWASLLTMITAWRASLARRCSTTTRVAPAKTAPDSVWRWPAVTHMRQDPEGTHPRRKSGNGDQVPTEN